MKRIALLLFIACVAFRGVAYADNSGAIMIACIVSSASTTSYGGSCPTSATTETQHQFPAATAGRASNLYVHCSGATTSTLTLRNAASPTALTCSTSASTNCADTTNVVDYAAGDLISFEDARGAGGGASLNCTFVFLVTTNGGGSNAHNAVFVIGDTNAATALNQFGAPSVGQDANVAGCETGETATTLPRGSYKSPTSGTFAGLGYRVQSAIAGAATRTISMRDDTVGSDSNLSVTLDSGAQSAVSSTCSSNCAFSVGDNLTISSAGSGSATKLYSGWWETTGNQVDASSLTSPGAGNPTWYMNSRAVSGGQVRVPRAAVLKNLYVNTTTNVTADLTVTVCSCTGAGCALVCTGTRPACTVSNGTATCSDLTNTVSLSAGDSYAVRIPGGKGGTIVGYSFELAGVATQRPLSPILYAILTLASVIGGAIVGKFHLV